MCNQYRVCRLLRRTAHTSQKGERERERGKERAIKKRKSGKTQRACGCCKGIGKEEGNCQRWIITVIGSTRNNGINSGMQAHIYIHTHI